MVDPIEMSLAQQGATFLYPEIPERKLNSEVDLVQGYRRQLGYNRLLGGLAFVFVAGWLADFVKGQ